MDTYLFCFETDIKTLIFARYSRPVGVGVPSVVSSSAKYISQNGELHKHDLDDDVEIPEVDDVKVEVEHIVRDGMVRGFVLNPI